MFIYLDESGDLGFDWKLAKTSEYFVITLLVCDNIKTRDAFIYAVRRTLKKLNHKNKKRLVLELKGAETVFSVKEYFLKQLPQKDWAIYSVILNKRNVRSQLKKDMRKHKLYNFLVRLAIEKIQFDKRTTEITLVADRCKNAKEIKEFNQYIEQHIQKSLHSCTSLHIRHETSHENQCLQAVDMFCWGILRKQQYQDSEWYDEFMKNIMHEIFI